MKTKFSKTFVLIIFGLLSASAQAQTASFPKPPETPKHPLTDEYHGVKVIDDYRWLENWDDPAVKEWSAVQNSRTREYLDHLPARPAIKERLKQLAGASSASYYSLQFRAGMLFAMKNQPPKQQPMLVVMRSADDPTSERIVVDPNAARAKGSLAIDFYVPSFGGKYVAAAMSENGSEDASAHVFDVATGKELADVVPRVNFATAGGSIAWRADNAGFYYTRYPQGNERPAEDANFYQQVYFHRLGSDPAKDPLVLGEALLNAAVARQHARVRDAEPLRRLALRKAEVLDTALGHEPRGFLCELLAQLQRCRGPTHAHPSLEKRILARARVARRARRAGNAELGIRLALRNVADLELLEDAVARGVARDPPAPRIDAVLDDSGGARHRVRRHPRERFFHEADPHRDRSEAALLARAERAVTVVEADPRRADHV